MSKLEIAMFSLLAFFLFIVFSSMENYPRDSIILFVFTVGMYILLAPSKDEEFDKNKKINNNANKFSEFIGTKIYNNTFFYDIDKIEPSANFDEDRSFNIHTTNEETGQSEIFPVNIDEMSVEDYIKSKQKSLRY